MSATVKSNYRGYASVRCVEPQDSCGACGHSRVREEEHENSGCDGGFYGCGWDGVSMWVEAFGMTEWQVEACPDCGGRVEAED